MGARCDCATCPVANFCLPAGLDDPQRAELAGLLIGRKRVRAGRDLCRQADPFWSLYAVRAGSFKASVYLPDGREIVTSFFMAGDVMGLDAIADRQYPCTLTALEDSEACVIPYRQLLEVSEGASSALRERVQRLLSVELARDRRLKLLLTQSHAEARVAAFLLMISARMQARGYSPTEFQLRMSRADIGSYLGLTLETVSRALSACEARGWTEVRKKRVKLIAPAQLRALCEAELPGAAPTHVAPRKPLPSVAA